MKLAAEGAAGGAEEDRQVAAAHFGVHRFAERREKRFDLVRSALSHKLDELMVEFLIFLFRPFLRPAHEFVRERAAGDDDRWLKPPP